MQIEKIPTDQAEREALFERQWAHVIAGLDRAVAWIKANKLNLKRGFGLNLDRENGIEISFSGWFDADDEDLKKVFTMFAGKQVTLTEGDINDTYILRDADVGLSFRWDIYRPRPVDPKPKRSSFVLPEVSHAN